MRLAWIAGIVTMSLVGLEPAAYAVCTGASAPAALDSFDKDPLAFIKANTGKTDIGDQVLALAAAAVNAKDPAFAAAFTILLRSASGDDGTGIGKALAGLVGTCTDPNDPGDKADKLYVAQNIESNLPVNTAANAAFGTQAGQAPASTGPGGSGLGTGGGTGLGIGSTGTPPPSGGSNGGSPTGGTTDTANAADSLPGASAGSTGASTTATQSAAATGSTVNSITTTQ